ncbi:MAG: YraN family protein [Deltaproteobacteria bacterium]|nr:YraN family protein [Deltaproteobacteria bacterium]
MYEAYARSYCKKQGYQILACNLWLGRAEIDCLGWDKKKGQLVIFEIRGRKDNSFRPSLCLTSQKVLRLRRLAAFVQLRYRKPVRIELVEVVGKVRSKPEWLISLYPEWFGLQFKSYDVV